MILLQLYWAFLQIGLFSVGGGYAAMPLIQSQVVEGFHWLSMGEFTDLVTIAEMTPGPIAINAATFVGSRIAGLAGSVAATLGCITPSLILVSLLAVVYRKYKNISVLQNVLASLRPAVVALIASAGLGILLQVLFSGGGPSFENLNLSGLLLFAGAFVILRKKALSPIVTLLLCGALGLGIGLLANALGGPSFIVFVF